MPKYPNRVLLTKCIQIATVKSSPKAMTPVFLKTSGNPCNYIDTYMYNKISLQRSSKLATLHCKFLTIFRRGVTSYEIVVGYTLNPVSKSDGDYLIKPPKSGGTRAPQAPPMVTPL